MADAPVSVRVRVRVPRWRMEEAYGSVAEASGHCIEAAGVGTVGMEARVGNVRLAS